jgi:hypothetical protein
MFSSRQLTDHMMEVFREHAQLVLAKLDQLKEFDVIDMQDLFYRYTLDSICQIAFGINIHSLASDATKQPAFATAFDAAQETSALRWFAPPVVWRFKKLFGIGCEGAMPQHIKVINEFVYDVVKQRKANLAHFENSQQKQSCHRVHSLADGEIMSRSFLTAVHCICSWCVVLGGDLLSLFLNDAKKRGEELSDEFLRDVILYVARYTRAAGVSFGVHAVVVFAFLRSCHLCWSSAFLRLPPSVTF